MSSGKWRPSCLGLNVFSGVFGAVFYIDTTPGVFTRIIDVIRNTPVQCDPQNIQQLNYWACINFPAFQQLSLVT